MIERVVGDVHALYFPCVGAICEDAAVFAVGWDRRKEGQTASALATKLWNTWSRQLSVKHLLGKELVIGGRIHCI